MAHQSYDHSAFIEGTLKKYQSIGWDTQVVLDQGARTVWLMQAMHIEHSDAKRGFQVQIECYKRQTNKAAFGEPEKTFTLNEKAVVNLFSYLQRQQALGEVDLGSEYIAIPVGHKIGGLSKGSLRGLVGVLEVLEAEQLEELLTSGHLTKEVLSNLGAVSQFLRHKSAVLELRNLLKTEKDERVYQNWFEKHPWICGTNYVARLDVRKIGLHEVTDIVMQTTEGYLDLFELKRPEFEVLRLNPNHKTYFFSTETSQAISQAANYISKTEENRYMLAQVEKAIFLKPRARIIIGRSSSWDKSKQDALRTLNATLHYIEVWTYDHVLAMAEQMVRLFEAAPRRERPEIANVEVPEEGSPADPDDCPF
jgi:hypothetical protein